ncbi:hypothetical protein Aperf_G00000090739 [Anoplocephala perfoliata]
MYNLQNSATSNLVQLNGNDNHKTDSEVFSVAKSVRISDETFYFGSTQSGSLKKGDTSGDDSPGSTNFSSIISNVNDVLVNKELDGFSPTLLSIATLKVPHARSQSDSLFVSTGLSSPHCLSPSNLHKQRFASEASAPIFKAAELHHTLLNLRLNLNNLYAERHKLQKELELTLIHRENLFANQRDGPSLPPNTERLLELREELAQESEKTARLLQLAVKAKQEVLDPESLDDINNLTEEYQRRRQQIVFRRVKSLEEQVELLKHEKFGITIF